MFHQYLITKNMLTFIVTWVDNKNNTQTSTVNAPDAARASSMVLLTIDECIDIISVISKN